MPLTISVVTPSFNQGCYLAETIESVIGQEGDFNLDYLIVDGGSSDDSVEIIKHYEKLLDENHWQVKCGKIKYRWLSEPDRGQTDALTKGFHLAEGEVLAWLNSDDVYLPGTLQTVTDFFRNHLEVGLFYGAAHYCDVDGEIVGRYPTESFNFRKLAIINFFCQPSTFFRKSAYETVGGLDETLHYTMDYDLFLRIGQKYDCHYLPQYFSKYRLHEAAKTMRDEVLFDNHEETLRVTMKYFNWAPINRVYGSCNYYCLSHWPKFLTRFRPLVISVVMCCAIFRSLRLNRGVRSADLQLLNLNNLRKLFKERIDILRG